VEQFFFFASPIDHLLRDRLCRQYNGEEGDDGVLPYDGPLARKGAFRPRVQVGT